MWKRRLVGCGTILVLAATSMYAALSAAPSPAERFAFYQQQFLHSSSAVDRLVWLYRLAEVRDLVPDHGQMVTELRTLRDAADSPLLRAEIQAMLADAELRQGKVVSATQEWSGLGLLRHWRTVGPFENASPDSIQHQEGPEKGPLTVGSIAAAYSGKQRQVRWKELPFPAAAGVVNLSLYFTPAQSTSAYLVTWVNSPRPQNVAFRLVDSGATRLWLNQQLLFDERGAHPHAGFDMHAVAGRLQAGWNELLLKVGTTETGEWRFGVRVTTPSGVPLQLTSDAAPHPTALAASEKPAPVADLTAEARQGMASPAGQLAYAWVLAHKGNFNAGSHDDTAAFEAGVAALPAGDPKLVGALLDFAEHDSDESRRYRTLQRTLRLEPGNAEARTDRGWIELHRREFWPARDDFETALGDPALGVARAPQAAVGLMQAYAGFGIRPESVRIADRLEAAGYGAAPWVAVRVADTLRSIQFMTQALHWAQLAFAADRGDASVGVRLAEMQRNAGDFTAALRTLQTTEVANPDVPYLEQAEAHALAGLGHSAAALAAMRRALAFDPDNPDLRVSAGDMERNLGDRKAALREWQLAAALNPQDADLRDRIRLTTGSTATAVADAGFEKPYRTTLAQAMADYSTWNSAGKASGPVALLVDTAVARVFPSGNVGRFVQQIFRINNPTGAASLGTYAVTFNPADEDVRFLSAHVQHADGSTADAAAAQDEVVNESVGYETFYDVRNRFVRLPALQPGDFVEIAYRVLPTSVESLYGDYFGDLVEFGGEAPKLLQQFVVLTPANKPLYSRAVRFTGQPSVQTVGDEKVYRWIMRDIPAQRMEPQAPPAIEQLPYIAVSSFHDWAQFGNWYLQLIRDTFVMDENLRRTTDDLVKNLGSPADKVNAIYNYVIRNTHYVALEFGIHGYRPYPVTQVFQRRFGDCKDKASLMVAMLARAGIAADVVLVRIRELGLVDPTIPAVADFDHAIVYVPSLHQYLDGTVEYNGPQELPVSDQRAFTFRIPAGRLLLAPDTGAEQLFAEAHPEVTPELPASVNQSSKTVQGTLSPEGDLSFKAQIQEVGGEAPALRGALQIDDRQAGAVQSMLHDALPGITVDSVQASGLHDFRHPVTVNFTGTIPRFASAPEAQGHSLLVPRQLVHESWMPRLAALATRHSAELLGPPQRISEEMRLTLPNGYGVSLPTDRHLTSSFADLQASARLEGQVLVLRSQLDIKQSLIPESDYAAFRAFWAAVDQELGRGVRVSHP